MFTDRDLEQLLVAMRRCGVTELEVEGDQGQIRLVVPVSVPATTEQTMSVNQNKSQPVKSPAMGTFVECGNDDGLSTIEKGVHVDEGQLLGYIAEQDVRLPVCAPFGGTVVTKAPDEGDLIGYGDVLFEIESAK